VADLRLGNVTDDQPAQGIKPLRNTLVPACFTNETVAGRVTQFVTFSERLQLMLGVQTLLRSLTTPEEAGGDAVGQTGHLGPLAI
jgi:hypothetical protein